MNAIPQAEARWLWPSATRSITPGRHFAAGHQAVDIPAPLNSAIFASRSGVVENVFTGCINHGAIAANGRSCRAAGCNPRTNGQAGRFTTLTWNNRQVEVCSGSAAVPIGGTGNGVTIRHSDGTFSHYFHMSSVASGIARGTNVQQGQTIGHTGATGFATGTHICFRITTHATNMGSQHAVNNNPFPANNIANAINTTAGINYLLTLPPTSPITLSNVEVSNITTTNAEFRTRLSRSGFIGTYGIEIRVGSSGSITRHTHPAANVSGTIITLGATRHFGMTLIPDTSYQVRIWANVDGREIQTAWQTFRTSALPTVAVTGVTIAGAVMRNMDVNATLQLNATVAPTNATNRNVTWHSNNTNVATVSANGLVTARAAGTATITVTTQDGNRTAQVNVTVTAPEPPPPPPPPPSSTNWLVIILGILFFAVIAAAAAFMFLV